LVLATAGRVELYANDDEGLPDMPLGAALTRQFYMPEFLSPSPLVYPQRAEHVAREIIAGEGTLLGAVEAIVRWVHANITYERGYTSVVTRRTRCWSSARASAMHLAHLTIGLMRSVWIPSRYVSGLLTEQVGETHACGSSGTRKLAGSLAIRLGTSPGDVSDHMLAVG
jgi:transglutaminase-like putative cysteine protease